MNLVIKNGNDTLKIENKLYRDALVTKGTLMLVDFSNKGTTNQYDISKGVFDLAREAAEDIGVYTSPIFSTRREIPLLTKDKGLPILSTGVSSSTDFSVGLNFKDVNRYMYEKQHKILVIMWLKLDMSRVNIVAGSMMKTDDIGVNGNIYFASGSTVNPYISGRIADKTSFANLNIGNGVYTQIAIEYTSATTFDNVYKNGVFLQQGTVQNGAFLAPKGTELLSIGLKTTNSNTNSPADIFRVIIEDLTVSGRRAEEVVFDDYNYCNGLGKYNGIQKRPFSNK